MQLHKLILHNIFFFLLVNCVLKNILSFVIVNISFHDIYHIGCNKLSKDDVLYRRNENFFIEISYSDSAESLRNNR